MSAIVPEMPAQQSEGFGADLAGMGNFFIDPAGAAKRVFSNWFWIGPLILFSIVSVIIAYLMIPITQHVLQTMPLPENANPEQFQRSIDMGMRFQRIAMWLSPIWAIVIYAIEGIILWGMCSVLGVNAKFRWLFNLAAGCSLISLLAAIASVVILKAKGEVSTMAELRPALGIDIFLPEGTNRFVMALAGYFSIFEVWWIVMMVLIFSRAFRTTKGKAFAAILPLILLSLAFRVVGAAFGR